MEIKLDSKLMKAVNGLLLFAIALIMMINSINWMIGLFLLIAACAQGVGAYLDKKDCKLATSACLYFLFAIVFFAKMGIAYDPFFLGLWVMIEGALLASAGFKAKEEKDALWMVPACLGAMAILFAFISCFLDPTLGATGNLFSGGISLKVKMSPVGGIALLFVALGYIFPFCKSFLKK